MLLVGLNRLAGGSIAKISKFHLSSCRCILLGTTLALLVAKMAHKRESTRVLTFEESAFAKELC